ncbi:phosphate acyltransferase [Floricoccus penangensis]|uniref:Phosphate acyltransferase n=1 Tax=Floricoccus penangensis TaxID=1859475 RepID=A0A9Q5JJ32_9LACT|nr:phosphate acyltransferase PlsX [Floricoccus penangensis]OFI47996.1 phosphate acyltransferase [Floricoccus penangensis]
MKIAVDAMGGDFAPKAIVDGVKLASKDFPNLEFILFGDEAKIKECLDEENKNISIVHTTQKIEGTDEPVKAIRKKKDSSMVRAAQAVKDGDADALLSAGNTGALLASGLFVIGRIKQVERPALLSTLPTIDGTGFDMLDLGANAENTAKHLHNYGTLGTFYAKNIRGIENPRVGLLNNGTEPGKGTPLTKEAFKLLEADETINFIGNIEARDLLDGIADVVVTDGFTGNAVLKTIEGTASNMMKLLKEAITESGLRGKAGALLLKNGLLGLKDKMDYEKAGGAVLFGVKAPVIKSHGSSKEQAIYSTIKQINRMLESNVVGQLVDYYQKESETHTND